MSRHGVQKWAVEIDASELHMAARTIDLDQAYGVDHCYGAQLTTDVCQKFASVAAQQPMRFIGGMIFTDLNSEDEDDESGFRIVANRTYRSSDAKSSSDAEGYEGVGVSLSDAEHYEVEAAMTLTGQLQATGHLKHRSRPAKYYIEAHEEEGPDNDDADGDADGNADGDDHRRRRSKKKEGKDIKYLFQKDQV